MKKILFSAAILVVSVFSLCAQESNFSKGAIFVNAHTTNLGLKISGIDGVSNTDFNLGAGGAFFIINKLAIVASFN